MDFDKIFDQRDAYSPLQVTAILRCASSKLGSQKFKNITLLTGGFNNVNYAVENESGDRFVLRISDSLSRFSSELAVLDRLNETDNTIPVPKVLWREQEGLPGGVSAAAINFIDGILLSRIAHDLDDKNSEKLYRQLGVLASKIHSFKFNTYGFLDDNWKPIDMAVNYHSWTLDYLLGCLKEDRLIARLGKDRHLRLSRCAHQNNELLSPPVQPTFCHGDFNQKNVLVSRDKRGNYNIAAILDWEYALAGSPAMDIGNLFRYEDHSSGINSRGFEDGYRSNGGILSNTWRDESLYIDLLALCGFLTSSEIRPGTYKSIIERIDSTINYFS